MCLGKGSGSTQAVRPVIVFVAGTGTGPGEVRAVKKPMTQYCFHVAGEPLVLYSYSRTTVRH